MRTIHKTILEIGEFVPVSISCGAEILSVQNQKEQLCIWYEFDQDEKCLQHRQFMVVGTGHSFDEKQEYIYLGTVQFSSGDLVLHVYEVKI